MTFQQGILLFFAAVIGGTLNAVAGGGSFFTFPALVFTNVNSVIANATSTVAVWPGSVSSMGAYRRELFKQQRDIMIVLIVISFIGGLLGAILLLKTPASTFTTLIPYLLLGATVLFGASPYITAQLRKRAADKPTKKGTSWGAIIPIALAQLVISIYGGYFGGGIGILLLATLAFMGMENIHEMNGVKTLLTACINGVAVITFIIARAVLWPQAIVMIVGAVIGGYGGAYYARKIEQKWIRLFVVVVGLALSIYFFVRH